MRGKIPNKVLTVRELASVKTMTETANMKISAQELGLSYKSVEWSLSCAKRKLGISSLIHLGIWAAHTKLVDVNKIIKTTVIFMLALSCSAALQPTNPPPVVSVSVISSGDPTVVAYQVYYGTVTHQYTNVVSLGSSTNIMLTLPARGMTYFFAATDSSANGVVSDLSGEATYSPTPPPNPPVPPVVVGPCSLTNGIAAYWPLSQNYTDAFSGFVLMPSNSPVFITLGSGALSSGPKGYAQIADNPTFGMGTDSSFSIAFWIWSQYGLGDYRAFVDKGTSYDGVHDTLIVGSDNQGHYRFVIGNGTNQTAAVVATNGTFTAFTRHQVVSVYDSARHQISITVDGLSNSPVPWTNGTWRNSAPLTILANSAGQFNQQAAMSDLTIWTNRALSSQEISVLYTNSVLGLNPLTFCSQ